ncbi:hypothetical protein Droror1_Dr00000165, partial [Drosera rotundifolia]
MHHKLSSIPVSNLPITLSYTRSNENPTTRRDPNSTTTATNQTSKSTTIVPLSYFQTRPGHRNVRNKDSNFNQRPKSWYNPSPILDLADPVVPQSVHQRSPPPCFSEM